MTELTELIRTERLAFIDLLESLTETVHPVLSSAWTWSLLRPSPGRRFPR